MEAIFSPMPYNLVTNYTFMNFPKLLKVMQNEKTLLKQDLTFSLLTVRSPTQYKKLKNSQSSLVS